MPGDEMRHSQNDVIRTQLVAACIRPQHVHVNALLLGSHSGRELLTAQPRADNRLEMPHQSPIAFGPSEKRG